MSTSRTSTVHINDVHDLLTLSLYCSSLQTGAPDLNRTLYGLATTFLLEPPSLPAIAQAAKNQRDAESYLNLVQQMITREALLRTQHMALLRAVTTKRGFVPVLLLTNIMKLRDQIESATTDTTSHVYFWTHVYYVNIRDPNCCTDRSDLSSFEVWFANPANQRMFNRVVYHTLGMQCIQALRLDLLRDPSMQNETLTPQNRQGLLDNFLCDEPSWC